MTTAHIDVYDDKHCKISAPYGGGGWQKLRPESWPGFAKVIDGSRDIRFRPTPQNIKYIQETWPNAQWSKIAQGYLIDFINEQKAAADTAKMKNEPIEDDGSYTYKTDPFQHQRHGFLLSRDLDAFAFFMEQGTGKTKVQIDRVAYKYTLGEVEVFIILAPNGVHLNWIVEELPTHLPDYVPREAFVYKPKKVKERKKKQPDGTIKKWFESPEYEVMIKSANDNRALKIIAFNIEGFTSAKAKWLLERILREHPSAKIMAAMDESQYCKNFSAMRTKYLTKAFRPVAKKAIMTGTNITKGIEDLYGQLNWLNPNILGFDTYTSFKNHFCTLGGFQGTQIIGYQNVDELINLIDGHSFRVLKKDCLDLPPKLYKRWKVELTPKQREIYNNLRREYYAELGDGNRLIADLGVVRLLRLQQIANGWFPADNAEDLIPIPGDNPKLEATLQHCRDSVGSVIIWCNCQASAKDIMLIEEELKREHGKGMVGTYWGGIDEDKRAENKLAFQKGDIKYIIGNKALARGHTLTICQNPIYHSNSFDLEVRLQSEDRCHRIGSEIHESITYTDVQALCQTDRQIINSLREKKNIADWVNRDPDSFFLEEAA